MKREAEKWLILRIELWFKNEIPFPEGILFQNPYPAADNRNWFQWYYPRLGDQMRFLDFKKKFLFSEWETDVDTALKFGFKILFIAPGSKIPMAGIRWTEEKYQEPSREEILEHLRKKHGNIAVIAGQSGIVEFDIDHRRTKRNTILRHFLDKTLVNVTPRGYHLLFRNDVSEDEGMEKVLSVVVESEADIVRKKNEYVVIPPSEITQEGIDRQKKANHEVNWTVGSYRWMVPLKPIMSYSLFLKRAKRLV